MAECVGRSLIAKAIDFQRAINVISNCVSTKTILLDFDSVFNATMK